MSGATDAASPCWSPIFALAFFSFRPQDITPTPHAANSGEPVATTFEVIVTGSNIPTAEEVGPQPVDTYRNIDIERLGVRSATDLVQKLPLAIGSGINENINTIGGGQTEIALRGLASKETLCCRMDVVSRLTVLPSMISV